MRRGRVSDEFARGAREKARRHAQVRQEVVPDELGEVPETLGVVERDGDRVLLLDGELALGLVLWVVLGAQVVRAVRVGPLVRGELALDRDVVPRNGVLVAQLGLRLRHLVLERAPLGEHARVVVDAPVAVVEVVERPAASEAPRARVSLCPRSRRRLKRKRDARLGLGRKVVHERVVDELLADRKALELGGDVVRRADDAEAGRGAVREVPVEEALVAAVVRWRREVRIHHVVEGRLGRLEDEDCRERARISECSSGKREKEGKRTDRPCCRRRRCP